MGIDAISLDEYERGIGVLRAKFPDIKELTSRDISKWMTEVLFESVRRVSFSTLPSRMTGVFFSSTLDEAVAFNESHRGGKASIYRCMLPEEVVCSFNMDLYTTVDERIRKNAGAIKDEAEFGVLKNLTKQYWNGCSYAGPSSELLCDLDVIELELVEERTINV